MKKIFIPLSVFLLTLTGFQWSSAETLKSLALRSTVLLTLSENDTMAKECHVDSEKISLLSQKLKAKVDKKVAALGPGDFKVIKARAQTCEQDCSCSIYALAIEVSGENNVMIERKAATESAVDRRRCVKSWKDYCQLIKF